MMAAIPSHWDGGNRSPQPHTSPIKALMAGSPLVRNAPFAKHPRRHAPTPMTVATPDGITIAPPEAKAWLQAPTTCPAPEPVRPARLLPASPAALAGGAPERRQTREPARPPGDDGLPC